MISKALNKFFFTTSYEKFLSKVLWAFSIILSLFDVAIFSNSLAICSGLLLIIAYAHLLLFTNFTGLAYSGPCTSVTTGNDK